MADSNQNESKRSCSPSEFISDANNENDEDSSFQEEALTLEDSQLLLGFQVPDLTLRIGGRKLHLKKEDLASASPVFDKMLNSDFKEAKATEIPLPGKKVSHMLRFLRYILPGFRDELKEKDVHDMLPLAEEYQTDPLKKRIDTFMANIVKEKGDTINSNQIVNNIKEAEKYNLPNYLQQCIKVAARKLSQRLTKCAGYKDISTETRLQIYSIRCSEVDDCLDRLSLHTGAYNGFVDVRISEHVATNLKALIQY